MRQKSETKRFGWFGSWLLFLVHGSVNVKLEKVLSSVSGWRSAASSEFVVGRALILAHMHWDDVFMAAAESQQRSCEQKELALIKCSSCLSVSLSHTLSVCLPPLTAPPLRPIIPVYFGLMRAGWDLLTIAAGILGLCILYILSTAVISSRAATRAGR